MTALDPRRPDPSSSPPDPGAGLKVAGLAVVAWAIIGVALRLTSGFDFAGEFFVLALLAPGAVGVVLSTRALLRSSEKFLSTTGLILNVFLVLAAVFLWISSQATP